MQNKKQKKEKEVFFKSLSEAEIRELGVNLIFISLPVFENLAFTT
jgi:hypothetical protein